MANKMTSAAFQRNEFVIQAHSPSRFAGLACYGANSSTAAGRGHVSAKLSPAMIPALKEIVQRCDACGTTLDGRRVERMVAVSLRNVTAPS